MRIRHKPLSKQVIVITGASSGIGLATARTAAARGAKVVLAARNAEALQEIVRDIQERGGEARFVVTDVTKREDVEALAAEASSAYGGFDTWVNNAGLSIFGRLEEVSDEDHRRLFDVNFWGLVHGSTVALKHLRERGGALINLGSIASDLAFPIQGMYCASKHAIKGFTDALRMELQSDDAPVSVTLIKPASIDTPFARHARNYTGHKPDLPPPVYDPQDVADAILHAAQHGTRDIYVGGGGRAMSAAAHHMPRVLDWMGARFMGSAQMRPEAAGPGPDALFDPGEDGQVRGGAPHLVMRSGYTKAAMHPVLSSVVLAAVGIAAMTALSRHNRR